MSGLRDPLGAAPSQGFAERIAARPLACAWLALAIASLVAGAAFAALVAGARTPGVGSALGLSKGFARALTMHVSLATTGWLLALLAAFWSAAVPRDTRAGWAGLCLAVLGIGSMMAAWARGAAAVLANYLPVLDDALFPLGLAMLATGAAMAGFRALRAGAEGEPAARHAFGLAAVPVGVAIAALAASWTSIQPAATAAAPHALAAIAEPLFWASGHALQFAYTLLAMGCWCVLLGTGTGTPAASPGQRLQRLALAVAVIPVVAVPLVLWRYPAESQAARQSLTSLMRWAGWPGAVLFAACLLHEARARGVRGPAAALARASIALFVAGLVLGAFIRGETTMVPAHYHATVGAATLAGLGVVLQALAGRRGAAPRWRIAALYGAGFTLLVGGLALAGAGRVLHKAASPHVLDAAAAPAVGMVAMGLGAVLAVGALLWLGSHALVTWREAHPARIRTRDARLRVILATAASILSSGALIAWVSAPEAGGAATAAAPPAIARTPDEVAVRFNQGVTMLHARQYEHAITAFHRVLALAPTLPEAHANLGYALIGAGRHRAARDFFESAIDLRAEQLNAYYGLAIALEALQDIGGAIGAMRTYTHLARADDPWLPKARAALWEWERSKPRPAGADAKRAP